MKCQFFTVCCLIGVSLINHFSLIQAAPKMSSLNNLSDSINDFGLNILKSIDMSQEENTLISPISLMSPFSMLLLGSSDEGVERTELSKLLNYNQLKSFKEGNMVHFDNKQLINDMTKSNNSTVSISNMVASNKDHVKLKANYIKEVSDYYNAQIEEFSAIEKVPISDYVNNWVSNKTNGMIPQLVSKDSLNNKDSTFALVNAVYFKGSWQDEFAAERIYDGTFKNFKGQEKKVKFMHREDSYKVLSKEPQMKELNASMMSLPYLGDEFDMIFLLPNNVNGSLRELEKSLTAKNMREMFESLDKKRAYTHEIAIPKFTIESSPDVKSAVQLLGLKSVFKSCNLSKMSEGTFKVSDVVHKTKIEVDEKGTKAAAATGLTVMLMSYVEYPRFTLNHPFIYMIRHKKSNSLLFIGRINNL